MRRGTIFQRAVTCIGLLVTCIGLLVLGGGAAFAQVTVDPTKGGSDGIMMAVSPAAPSEGDIFELGVTLYAFVGPDVIADETRAVTLASPTGATLLSPEAQDATFAKHSGVGSNAQSRSATVTYRLFTEEDDGGDDESITLSVTAAAPFASGAQTLTVQIMDKQTQVYTLERTGADKAKAVKAPDTVILAFKSTLPVEEGTNYFATTSNSAFTVDPLGDRNTAEGQKVGETFTVTVPGTARDGDFAQIVITKDGDAASGVPSEIARSVTVRVGQAVGGTTTTPPTPDPDPTPTPTGNEVVATWTASYMPGDDEIEVMLSGTDVGDLYADGDGGTFTLTNAGAVRGVSTDLPTTRQTATSRMFTLGLSGALKSTPHGTGRVMLEYAWTPRNGILSYAGRNTNNDADRYIAGNGPSGLTEIDIAPDLPAHGDVTWTTGEEDAVMLKRATGGNGPLSYHMTSQSDLPTGLEFDPGTATRAPEIYGTPTAAADVGKTFTVYYEVRDDNENLSAAEVMRAVHTEDIEPFNITVTRPAVDPGDGMYGRVTSTTLTSGGGEVDTKNIGGKMRYHVLEGVTNVELEVDVTWTVEELRSIYGSATKLADPDADLVVGIYSDSTMTTAWASMIDDQQDVHFPNASVTPAGVITSTIKVPYPPNPAASARDADEVTETGELRVYILEDDFEAESEVFYIEVVSSNDVVLDPSVYGRRAQSYRRTHDTIIEDNDPQGVVLKKASTNKSVTVDNKERILENAGTAKFTVTADPERYDLPLEVRLDLVTFETGTVVRGDKYSLSDASPTLNSAGTGGTAANMATVTMEFPSNDGDRIDNYYTLQATAIDYSLASGVDTTIEKDPAEHHITLVDVHKLPLLTVTPQTATLEEGGETTLTLMINREIREPGLGVQKATSEAVTVMLTAGAGSTAGNRDYDLPAMVSFPKKPATGTTQTMEVTIEAMADDMLDADEMLMVDAEVDGTVPANGPNSDMDMYPGVSTVNITDATAKLVYAKTDAELAAAIEAAGLDAALTSGDAIPIMGSALFGSAEGATVIYSAMSSDATVATSSVSGSEIMIMAVGKGDAMITVEASASMSSGVTVNKQTEPDRASIEIPVSVALAPLSIMLEGPDAGMNLVEGMEYTITAMANRAVEMDTMVELIQTDGTASPADYEVEPITIKMGESMGTTKLMVAEDGMMENEGNMAEMLTLEGRVGTMMTNSLMFYLWDVAVPALPVIAQLLLAAFLALGGYRRYRRLL